MTSTLITVLPNPIFAPGGLSESMFLSGVWYSNLVSPEVFEPVG